MAEINGRAGPVNSRFNVAARALGEEGWVRWLPLSGVSSDEPPSRTDLVQLLRRSQRIPPPEKSRD